MRIQSAQGQIEVVREFGVQNTSKPPRTQMNERNLEFYIPNGAQIIPDSATATTENGNPLKSAPVPEGEKNRYSFIFPLRPGLTRFEVAYQLPYTGSANLDPKSIYPLEHFVVMTPKTMQFTAAAASRRLQTHQLSERAGCQRAGRLQYDSPGQNLAFKVSGEGTLAATAGRRRAGPRTAARARTVSSDRAPEPRRRARPGGGLGPPIDAPDPLQKYRWQILGGFAAVLIIGGVYVALRQQSAARALARQKPGSVRHPRMQDEDDYAAAEILRRSRRSAPVPARCCWKE